MRKSTHEKEFEHPSHITVVIYDIDEYVSTLDFHVVILGSFTKIQECVLFTYEKYQKLLLFVSSFRDLCSS